MDSNFTGSERLAEIIDKIFLLNHNIVNLMLSSYRDEEMKKTELLNKAVEKVAFDKLSGYYSELREAIREAIEISDEINSASLEGAYSEGTANEILCQSREKAKQSIISSIKTRIEGLFTSMNFVPITIRRTGEERTEVIESVYAGEPEEALRGLEYTMLAASTEKQIEIIEYEDYFEKMRHEKAFTISPAISPLLIDGIVDRSKFALGEEHCKKFSQESREQEEVFDEYPELKEVTEFSEYLMLEEHYKKMFEQSVGLLNSRTTYGDYFFSLYKNGNLPLYTGFSKQEIDYRISEQVKAYSEWIKDVIKNKFDDSVKKHRATRIKRNLKDATDVIRLRLSGIVRKRYIRKIGEEPEPPKVKESNKAKIGSKSKLVKKPDNSEGR